MNLAITVRGVDRQIVRFAINGLVATGIHYCVLALLIEAVKIPSAGLANGIAAVFGIASSYLGGKSFVFASAAPARQTLPRFLLLYAAVAALHMAALAIWTDYWKWPYTIGFLIATIGSMALTFLGNRFLVFVDRAERDVPI